MGVMRKGYRIRKKKTAMKGEENGRRKQGRILVTPTIFLVNLSRYFIALILCSKRMLDMC